VSELDPSTFRTLAENALDAIILADASMAIIYANRAAYRLFGTEDLVGMSAMRFWQEKDLPFVKQTLIPQAAAGGWAGEVQNMRCDGSIFDALASAFLIRAADGQTVGMAVLLRDITARQRNEEALRASEENLRTVFENMQDTYYRSDLAGTMSLVSSSGLALLGCDSMDQLIGHKVAEFYADPAVREKLVAELRANGKVTDFEIDLRRTDGRVITVSTNSHFYKDRSGKVAGIEGIFRDVTARKQAEKALQASEERFRRFSAVTTEGMVFQENNLISDANPAIVAMLGYSDSSDVIGRPTLDFVAPHARATVIQHIREGSARPYEASLVCKDGSFLPVEILGQNYEADGSTIRAATFHDITARKQAEAERAALQEQVIEAQRHALQELSTPIIPVLERIIVMPLIGSIDTLRAKDITRALLAGISHYRAKIVIVDITGVPLVDSGVADHLNKTIQAARLKGAQTIVTGMSDAVAEAIIDLGIDWSNVQTLSDLQTGLMVAINILGLKLSRQ
jgi:rsbT co-antagonist protein RsbR